MDDLNTPKAICGRCTRLRQRPAIGCKAPRARSVVFGLFRELQQFEQQSLSEDSGRVSREAWRSNAPDRGRSAARTAKDFKEADRIRDELEADGHHAEGRQGPARPASSSRPGRSPDDQVPARMRRSRAATASISSSSSQCSRSPVLLALHSCSSVAVGQDHDPRTPLSLRHHAARRRADARASTSRSRTSWPIARACSTRSGIDYIEGGYPGANPTDTAFFAETRELARARFTAFGMTKRAGPLARQRSGACQALLAAKTDAICFVGKTWDFHVRVALGITHRGKSRGHRSDSVEAVAPSGPRGAGRLRAFLRRLQGQSRLRASPAPRRPIEAGARWVVLCDTNGGTLPRGVERIVARGGQDRARRRISASMPITTPSKAVANSLAAVRAGARQIQGTLNGLGERCGNANLVSIIPTLMLKSDFRRPLRDRRRRRSSSGRSRMSSRLLDELLNRAPNRHAPYVGAFGLRHQGRHPCLRRA